ncbi:hypothetical protein CGRA01v4_11432 [Colletotrichum graminicola]|nr:hypothetical protein CGRA01v4_11432 [Colletotrichum graminicola]
MQVLLQSTFRLFSGTSICLVVTFPNTRLRMVLCTRKQPVDDDLWLLGIVPLLPLAEMIWLRTV